MSDRSLEKIRGAAISMIYQEPGIALSPVMRVGAQIVEVLHAHKPAILSDEEYAVMKKHPEFGWAVLRHVPGMERASLMILHHHESFDGLGYPAGLKGQEIPVISRIVSVIDAFDAMVSNRPYREGLPVEEAIRRLVSDRGRQFDPKVVDSFLPLARAEVCSVFAAAGTSISAVL